MRPIKFRAWHKTREVMYQNVIVGGFVIYNQGGIRSSDCEFMQSTGLLDKNGNEIYEGDIVISHIPENSERSFSKEYKGPDADKEYVQKSYDTKPYIVSMDIPYAYFDMPGKGKWEEIMGNIYENPDLLSSQK